jgi:hypothetical protein
MESSAANPKLTVVKKTFAKVVIVFGSALMVYWLVDLEPAGPWRCEEVRVLGVVKGSRGTEYFDVQSVNTAQRRRVGRFNRPFPEDYTGLAALWIRARKWTGLEDYEMTNSCSDSIPNQ